MRRQFLSGGVIIAWLALIPASNVSAQCGPQCQAVCQGGSGGGCPGGGGNGGGRSYVPRGPSASQIRAQQADELDDQGFAAYQGGDYSTAVDLFEQALSLEPSSKFYRSRRAMAQSTILAHQGLDYLNKGDAATALSIFQRANALFSYSGWRELIAKAQNALQEAQTDSRKERQNAIIQQQSSQAVSSLVDAVTTAQTRTNSLANSGLTFKTADTPSDQRTVASNFGDRVAKPDFKTGGGLGVIAADSTRGQLLNSRKESNGQLFENREDEARANGIVQNIGTPSSQASPLDPKFAGDKGYQVAAMQLANVQAGADAVNTRMADLQSKQTASPTQERQIEISNLSVQVQMWNGAVLLATNKLADVKQKIIKSGPAIVVTNAGPATVQSTSAGAPK